jgi:putative transposase
MTDNNFRTSDILEKFPPGLADEIQTAIQHANLPIVGENYVRAALASPSRRVGCRTGNVCGRFASRKMGITVEFESRTIELSQILSNEANSDVIAFLSQPPQIKFNYHCSKSGRNRGYLRTPDLLEFSSFGITLVECKTEAELRETAIERPDVISKSHDGHWRCPPGEVAAEALVNPICRQNESEI